MKNHGVACATVILVVSIWTSAVWAQAQTGAPAHGHDQASAAQGMQPPKTVVKQVTDTIAKMPQHELRVVTATLPAGVTGGWHKLSAPPSWRDNTDRSALAVEAAKERLKSGAYHKLLIFATDSRFIEDMEDGYGSGYNINKARNLRDLIIAGDLSWIPEIEVVSNNTMPYAASAFSEKENRIFINNRVLDTPIAAIAYLEEVGHYLDSVLNERDTAGDEGENFMRLVGGLPLRQSRRSEDGSIVVDGRIIEVEFGILGDIWDVIEEGGELAWEGLVDLGPSAIRR